MKILEHILNTIIRSISRSISIACSLVSWQVEKPLMQFSYLDSYKESTCKRRKHLLCICRPKKRLSIVHLVEFFGGQCENLKSMNGLFKLLSLCMTMLVRKSESQTAITTQLTFQQEYIKDLC